jgi:hypothetical protein
MDQSSMQGKGNPKSEGKPKQGESQQKTVQVTREKVVQEKVTSVDNAGLSGNAPHFRTVPDPATDKAKNGLGGQQGAAFGIGSEGALFENDARVPPLEGSGHGMFYPPQWNGSFGPLGGYSFQPGVPVYPMQQSARLPNEAPQAQPHPNLAHPTIYHSPYGLPLQSVVTVLVQSVPYQVAPLPYGPGFAATNQTKVTEINTRLEESSEKTEDLAPKKPKPDLQVTSVDGPTLLQPASQTELQLSSTRILSQSRVAKPKASEKLSFAKTVDIHIPPKETPKPSASFSFGSVGRFLQSKFVKPPASQSFETKTSQILKIPHVEPPKKADNFTLELSRSLLSNPHKDPPKPSEKFELSNSKLYSKPRIELPKKSESYATTKLPLINQFKEVRIRSSENLSITKANVFSLEPPRPKPAVSPEEQEVPSLGFKTDRLFQLVKVRSVKLSDTKSVCEKEVNYPELTNFCAELTPEGAKKLFLAPNDKAKFPIFRFDRLKEIEADFQAVWGRREEVFKAIQATPDLGKETADAFKEVVEEKGLGLYGAIFRPEGSEKPKVFFILVSEDGTAFDSAGLDPTHKDLVRTLTRLSPSHTIAIHPADVNPRASHPSAPQGALINYQIRAKTPTKSHCDMQFGKNLVPKSAPLYNLFGKANLVGFCTKSAIAPTQKGEIPTIVYRTSEQYADFSKTHCVKLKDGVTFGPSHVEKFISEKAPSRLSKLRKDFELEKQKIDQTMEKLDPKVLEDRLNFTKVLSIVGGMSAFCPEHLKLVKKGAAKRGPAFQVLLAEVLEKKDKLLPKDNKAELTELDTVYQNVLLESDKRAIIKFGERKMVMPQLIAAFINLQKKACIQELYKTVNKRASQTTLEVRRKSISKSISLDDIAAELKAIKAEPGFMDGHADEPEKDAFLVWDALNQRITENFEKGKALEKMKKDFRDTLEKDAQKKLCREELRKMLESMNEMEPVSITGIKTGKAERGTGVVDWEFTYEFPDQPEAGSEIEVFRLEASKRRGSDVGLGENPAVALGEKFFNKIQLKEGLVLSKLFCLKKGSQIAISSVGAKTEIRLSNRLKFGSIDKISVDGKVVSADASAVSDSFVLVLKEAKGVMLRGYKIDSSEKITEEWSLALDAPTKLASLVDLTVLDSGDIYAVTEEGSLHRIDHKTRQIEAIDSGFKDAKRILSLGDQKTVVFVLPGKILPYFLVEKGKMALIDLPLDLDVTQTALISVNEQIQLLGISKGKIQGFVLNFRFPTVEFELKKEDLTQTEESKKGEVIKAGPLDYYGHVGSFGARPGYGEGDGAVAAVLRVASAEPASGISTGTVSQKAQARIASLKRSKPNWFLLNVDGHKRIEHVKPDSKTPLNSANWVKNDLEFVVREILCLVPVQVSGMAGNNFVLGSKESPVNTEDVNNIFDLVPKISIGPYSNILGSWNKPVKVISYRSDDAGAATTQLSSKFASIPAHGDHFPETCWVSATTDEDCLYVLLVIGPKAVGQASSQSDLITTTLTSALSDLSLYELKGYSPESQTDPLKGLVSGADLLKGSEKAFKGSLSLAVLADEKPKIEQAKEDLVGKVVARVEKEKESNFIHQLYQSGFQIVSQSKSAFGHQGDDLTALNLLVSGKTNPRFTNGPQFESFFRLILARLALQDFTSLKDQELQARLRYLKKELISALKFGQVEIDSPTSGRRKLRNLDDLSDSIDANSTIQILPTKNSAAPTQITYHDNNLSLGGSRLAPIETFEISIPRKNISVDEWGANYRKFVEQVIKNRTARVDKWLSTNLNRFRTSPENKEVIKLFEADCRRKVMEFTGNLTVCGEKCAQCFSFCTQFERHSNPHDCGATSHNCKENCGYCEAEGESKECTLKFGHGDKHLCDKTTHLCRKKCEVEFCEQVCRQNLNHGGEHKCSVKSHQCLRPCSVPNCAHTCKIAVESPHTLHLCEETQCPQQCSVKGCTLRCSIQNHLHLKKSIADELNRSSLGQSLVQSQIGPQNSPDFHTCGNEHQCEEQCSESGVCKVMVERKLQEIEFKGARDLFSFHKYYETRGVRMRCIQPIPAGQLAHAGPHMHTEADFDIHTCETKCPTCNNYCELETGHKGRHRTSHKNMENCHLVSDQKNIDIGDHKYVVGESSAAEMCHIFCKRLGRGHIHLVKCGKTKGDCVNEVEGQRVHESKKYGPDFEVSKDELSHDAYWEMINFEDPCTEGDRELFRKCMYYCGADEHSKGVEDRNYCQLDMWHPKNTKPGENGKNRGWFTPDGHNFVCEHKHPAKSYHFVLCLDDSGSMNGKPWADLSEAVKSFAFSRLVSRNDRLSIIQFNEYPIVMCEYMHFENFDVDKHLKFRAGGTEFGVAILRAHDIIKARLEGGLSPVFIFMSDGKSDSGEAEMKALATEFAPKGLRTFTISFDTFTTGNSGPSEKGRRAERMLRKLAELAGGTHLSSISGVQLKENFMEISSAFRTTIGVMSAI